MKPTEISNMDFFTKFLKAEKLWNKRIDFHTPLEPIIYVLSVLMLPVIILTIAVFGIFKFMVGLCLRAKYKTNFGGLVTGGDVLWTIEEETSKNIINTLLIIDIKDQTLHSLKQSIINRVKNTLYRIEGSKITGIRQSELGYTFLLKNQYTAEEAISFLPDINNGSVLEERELEDIVSEYSNKPLPKNDLALWQILIGRNPVNYKGSKHYFLIFRIHHIVGDGSSLIQTMLDNFGDCVPKPPATNFRKEPDFVEQLVYLLNGIYTFIISFAFLVNQSMFKHNDSSSLHGKELSGEKIVLWNTDEYPNLLEAVRAVKNKIPDTKFSEIIFSAISAGISDYFCKISENPPETATAIVPVVLTSSHTKLSNTFTIGLIDIPIALKSSPTDNNILGQRLDEVKTKVSLIKELVDYKINYWVLTVLCPVLPIPFLKLLVDVNKCTMGVSNLPGCCKISIFNGCNLKDIVFWVPHRGKTGLGFSILTYDNRLQLGLNVDKALMPTKEDAQTVLNGISKYIVSLNQEVIGKL
ncbi:uncharacterized protein LOC109599170 isoform X2 [Aethina tumida]|uniref:uncharacterized protein LOC109599170 isoform X2 n=1 Tax=Aethina tumida TaxID=116153 RepID=UPI0021484573|nr:uncharacterized protein LOC109599170 isoform X2 [Aethina tumida]